MPLLGKPPKAADFPAKLAQLMGFSVIPYIWYTFKREDDFDNEV